MCHIAVQDVSIPLSDDDGAPGQRLLAVQTGDIVSTPGRHEIQAVEATNLLFQRIGRKLTLQHISLTFLEIHARIVLYASIHHNSFHATGQTDSQRGDGQRVGKHLRQWLLVVIRLKAVTIALASTIVVDIRHKSLIVISKTILYRLAVYHQRFCVGTDEAVGGTVVVGTHLNLHLLVAVHHQLAIVVVDLLLFIEGCGEAVGNLTSGHLAYLAYSQRLTTLLHLDVDG